MRVPFRHRPVALAAAAVGAKKLEVVGVVGAALGSWQDIIDLHGPEGKVSVASGADPFLLFVEPVTVRPAVGQITPPQSEPRSAVILSTTSLTTSGEWSTPAHGRGDRPPVIFFPLRITTTSLGSPQGTGRRSFASTDEVIRNCTRIPPLSLR